MTTQMPDAFDPSPPDPRIDPRVIAGIYRDGVIHPAEPLDLPPDSPVLIVAAPYVTQRPGSASPIARIVRVARQPWLHQARSRLPVDALRAWAVRARPLLLAGAIGLALFAQWRFLDQRAFDLLALLAAIVAAPLLALGLVGVDLAPLRPAPPEPEPPAPATLHFGQARMAAIAGSALCTAALLIVLAQPPPPGGYNAFAILWVAAIALAVAAFTPRLTLSLWRTRRVNLGQAALLGGILLATLLLRIWQVGTIPPTLGGDEGSQGLEAMKVLNGEITNPFGTGWLGVPTMSFYFNALSIALFGNTAFALRLPWVLVGTATVLVSYLLVARLQGPVIGLLTAGFLAGFHYHIHFSRLGSIQVADILFVALALLLLYRGYDRRDPAAWAWCGATIGVAQFFYAGARFTAIVVAVTAALFIIRDGRRFWREQRLGVVALLWVALVGAAPMLQYAYRFPADFNARINDVGIFQSGWLAREQEILGVGPIPILIDQFWRAALLYNAYPDRTVWYGAPLPLFSVAEGALFILGLGYTLLRLGDRRLFPMLAWWGGAVVLGGMLTESPPSLQRMITTAVPAAFFLCLGLILALRGVWAIFAWRNDRVLRVGLGATTLTLALLSINYYFTDYTPRRIYGNQNAVVATALADYILTQTAADTQVVFFGPPRMYYGFGTIPYLTGKRPGIDVREPLSGPIDSSLAAPGDNVIFVFLPERLDELEHVTAVFPRGEREEIPAPHGDALLFVVYRPAT